MTHTEKQLTLTDKVCIITGSGKGIGRATAGLFYDSGAQISLVTREMEDLLGLSNEAAFDDDRVLLHEGDVSNQSTVCDFVSKTVDKFGHVDVLINNAGMRFRKSFLNTSMSEWNNVIQTNLGSAYLMCREVGKHMVRQRQGKIINMASIVGTLGLPELAAYGASKGGMITLTKCLALEWAEYNINVNAIAPGFCATSYAENFKKKSSLYDFTIERTPQKKWGTSLDVANTCLFLSTEASQYITGEVLSVDGGWSAW